MCVAVTGCAQCFKRRAPLVGMPEGLGRPGGSVYRDDTVSWAGPQDVVPATPDLSWSPERSSPRLRSHAHNTCRRPVGMTRVFSHSAFSSRTLTTKYSTSSIVLGQTGFSCSVSRPLLLPSNRLSHGELADYRQSRTQACRVPTHVPPSSTSTHQRAYG